MKTRAGPTLTGSTQRTACRWEAGRMQERQEAGRKSPLLLQPPGPREPQGQRQSRSSPNTVAACGPRVRQPVWRCGLSAKTMTCMAQSISGCSATTHIPLHICDPSYNIQTTVRPHQIRCKYLHTRERAVTPTPDGDSPSSHSHCGPPWTMGIAPQMQS